MPRCGVSDTRFETKERRGVRHFSIKTGSDPESFKSGIRKNWPMKNYRPRTLWIIIVSYGSLRTSSRRTSATVISPISETFSGRENNILFVRFICVNGYGRVPPPRIIYFIALRIQISRKNFEWYFFLILLAAYVTNTRQRVEYVRIGRRAFFFKRTEEIVIKNLINTMVCNVISDV